MNKDLKHAVRLDQKVKKAQTAVRAAKSNVAGTNKSNATGTNKNNAAESTVESRAVRGATVESNVIGAPVES